MKVSTSGFDIFPVAGTKKSDRSGLFKQNKGGFLLCVG